MQIGDILYSYNYNKIEKDFEIIETQYKISDIKDMLKSGNVIVWARQVNNNTVAKVLKIKDINKVVHGCYVSEVSDFEAAKQAFIDYENAKIEKLEMEMKIRKERIEKIFYKPHG